MEEPLYCQTDHDREVLPPGEAAGAGRTTGVITPSSRTITISNREQLRVTAIALCTSWFFAPPQVPHVGLARFPHPRHPCISICTVLRRQRSRSIPVLNGYFLRLHPLIRISSQPPERAGTSSASGIVQNSRKRPEKTARVHAYHRINPCAYRFPAPPVKLLEAS